MDFIHDDFLLHSKAAQKLYHGYAAQQPILDYHSHLPPADIAEDRRFQNLFEPVSKATTTNGESCAPTEFPNRM